MDNLETYLVLKNRIKCFKGLLETYNNDIDFVRSMNWTVATRGKYCCELLNEAKKDVIVEIKEMQTQQQVFLEKLKRIENKNHRWLLYHHYVLGETWEDIAFTKNVGLRNIYRMRERAIKSFEQLETATDEGK